jgi:hypothetical protein
MHALRIHEQAGPEGLCYEEAPRPEPGTGDVLVRVRAASFTPTELTWPSTWVDRLGHDRRPARRSMRRTWAPRGRTPVIRHHFKWKRASMAAALCYGSRGGGAQLPFYHQVGAYDTDTLIGALEGCAASSVGRRPPWCGTGCPPTAAGRCTAGCAGSGPGWWWSRCPPTPPS